MTDLVQVLAHLADDAQVTISIRKADLVKALEARAVGSSFFTTIQASRLIGYTRERWRRWAAAGVLEGAYQERSDGIWHLPRASCEAHIALLQRRGIQPGRGVSLLRSVPRGPWKAKAQTRRTAGAK